MEKAARRHDKPTTRPWVFARNWSLTSLLSHAYRQLLAGNCVNFGNFLEDGEAEQRLTWYDKAIVLMEPLVRHEPRLVRDATLPSKRPLGTGQCPGLAGPSHGCDQGLGSGVGIEQRAGEDVHFRLNRARSRALAGDHAQATAEAEALTKGEKIRSDSGSIAWPVSLHWLQLWSKTMPLSVTNTLIAPLNS